MKYYDIDKKCLTYIYKSSLWIDCTSLVKLIDSKNMHIKCVKKSKTYYFVEPTSNHVNFHEEDSNGRNCFIQDWVQKI